MTLQQVQNLCDDAYLRFNHAQFIHPDPLEVVLRQAKEDREVVGLLSACLALGRVDLIMKAVESVLQRIRTLGKPSEAIVGILNRVSLLDLERALEGFRYRFFNAHDLAFFCFGLGEVLRIWGSLGACFSQGAVVTSSPVAKDVLAGSPAILGLAHLVGAIRNQGGPFHPILLSDPSSSSANKRLHLFLRWMVRKDSVDSGEWNVLSPDQLWMPLDTHSYRHCRSLGLSKRSAPDARAVEEVTNAFRQFSPEDPCRFDFALSRMGIHPEAKEEELGIYLEHSRTRKNTKL